jgi:ATP-dependent RNA helicase DDX46/PRP5
MASRHADSRRFPDDRRDRPSRDHRDGRRREDRYRDTYRERDRVDRYERDSYRRRSRSRSPLPHDRRRERSRDGYRRHDERERTRDYRDNRDNRYSRERDDAPRDRERDRERDRDRERERDRTRDRDLKRPGSRGSASVTPGAEVKRPKLDDKAKHDEKPNKDAKDADKDSKLARLEKWKKLQAQKKASAKEANATDAKDTKLLSVADTQSPATKEAHQPVATNGHAQDVVMTNGDNTSKTNGEKPNQEPTESAQESDVGKPNFQQVRIGSFKSLQLEKKASAKDAIMVDTDSKNSARDKQSLLQDEEDGQKKSFKPLEEWQDPHAEKENTAEDPEKMDTAEDIDPLDAFMNGLDTTASLPEATAPKRGEAMFGEDTEPTLQSVGDDMFALVPKKKKKEIPTIDHSKVNYEPFRKSFYTEPIEISDMTEEEVADLRLELDGIKVKPADVPRPVLKWAQMGLSQQTIDVLQQIGYTKPTSIQSQAIPIILSGKDMIGVAKTGSGKTLAFGMPIIRHALDQPPLKSLDGPIALILAPTRELSLQIVAELKPFLKASNLKVACAYGGAPISDQIAAIKRGVHVLCATPGRLIDLLQSNQGRVLRFNRVTYVVIDEADRMFDMGFGPQVAKIMANVRPDRQTLFFSATFPRTISDLARKTLTNPAEVIIGGTSVVAPEITQVIKVIPPNEPEKKVDQVLLHLGQVYAQDEDARALIFVERQEMAEDLFNKLLKKGYPCNTIHGGKDQHDRTDAISDFKNGAIPLLIATSVAARGLDVLQLKLVINYDCPTHLEDYVHRCGRTGRAGNKGTAVTFIENPGQERYAIHLVKALKASGCAVPDDLKEMADAFWKKVEAGTEKMFSGFGGKGLDRLDAARNLEKKREKRLHKGEFGDDGSDSEEEILPPPVVDAAATPAANDKPTEEPAYRKILERGIVVHKAEPRKDDKKLSLSERVALAAQEVNSRLSRKGTIHHGQPIDNKGPDAGAFHSTIEINDFPQKARWAVTNRTNVAKILESTGTSITTKGTYYPPGKEPGENDLAKLYILVEGDTENVVQAAMMEITRLLRDGTMAAEEAGSARPTGRYSVM